MWHVAWGLNHLQLLLLLPCIEVYATADNRTPIALQHQFFCQLVMCLGILKCMPTSAGWTTLVLAMSRTQQRLHGLPTMLVAFTIPLFAQQAALLLPQHHFKLCWSQVSHSSPSDSLTGHLRPPKSLHPKARRASRLPA